MNILEKLTRLEIEAADFGFAWETPQQIMAQIQSECFEILAHLPDENQQEEGPLEPARNSPSQEEISLSQGETPLSQGETPLSQGETPPSQGETPPSQGAPPPSLRAQRSNPSADLLQEEIGDLLHAAFSLAVFCGFSPEETLRKSLDKFECRFNTVKNIAEEKGLLSLKGKNFEELMALWREAKGRVG